MAKGQEPEREGGVVAGEFLGLGGVAAAWCGPVIKTNPQSFWVPAKFDCV